jgi:pre-mRNA-processing factor 19
MPKPLIANSVPGMLSMLQTEWDAVMLDIFNLRKALDDSRKELAHALYQHDAACRVISRLLKEKDQQTQIMKLTNDEL